MILVRNSLDNSENKCSGNPRVSLRLEARIKSVEPRTPSLGFPAWDSRVKMSGRVVKEPGIPSLGVPGKDEL